VAHVTRSNAQNLVRDVRQGNPLFLWQQPTFALLTMTSQVIMEDGATHHANTLIWPNLHISKLQSIRLASSQSNIAGYVSMHIIFSCCSWNGTKTFPMIFCLTTQGTLQEERRDSVHNYWESLFQFSISVECRRSWGHHTSAGEGWPESQELDKFEAKLGSEMGKWCHVSGRDIVFQSES